jgi:hypothetical protein
MYLVYILDQIHKWFNELRKRIFAYIWNRREYFIVMLESTLQTGRCGSLMLTNRFSHFKSKCTMFFPCKYSIPNAASMAIMSLFRRSIVLLNSSEKTTQMINYQSTIFFQRSINHEKKNSCMHHITCPSYARTVSKIH